MPRTWAGPPRASLTRSSSATTAPATSSSSGSPAGRSGPVVSPARSSGWRGRRRPPASSTSRSTATTSRSGAHCRSRAPKFPISPIRWSSSSMTSSSPDEPSAPRSTRSPPSAARAPPSWRCSSIAAPASSPCEPISSVATCRRPHARTCACCSRNPTERTEWRSMRSVKADNARHLLSITDLGRDEIAGVLSTAEEFEAIGEREIKKVPTLRGRTVVNLFYENSTRTRVSFEIAAKRLSADVINVSSAASSVEKGESLRDTARTLRALGADAIVLRHPAAGAPAFLAGLTDACVINAGDGAHEHPTQALLDLYTVNRHFGSVDALRVGIVGDIAHSRVARSGALGFKCMGADVVLIAPPTLLPLGIEALGSRTTYDLDAELGSLDVLYVLRMQRERHREPLLPSEREFWDGYALTTERLAKLRPDAGVMHARPMNRGVEIEWEAAESEVALIESQVSVGVAVRMAMLYLLMGGAAVPGGAGVPPAGEVAS